MTELNTQVEQGETATDVRNFTPAHDGGRPSGSAVGSVPWHAQPGVEGMDVAVRQLKEVARQIDERVEFSVPFVDRFAHDCDGQGESVYVVVHVLIPPEWDGFEFRDRFFGRLADAIEPEDGMRLAVGVRYRG